MANWWEAAPRVDEAPEPSQDEWWNTAPIVQAAPARPAAPQQESGYARQAFSGLLEGATGALGAPVDLLNNFVVSPALRGVNAAFGTDFQPSAEPLGGSAGLRRGLAIDPETDNTGHRMARRVSQSVGGALVPLSGSARTAGQAAAGIGTAIGGGFGGAAAQQLFPGNTGAEIVGELLAGLGTGSAISGMANRSARRAAERAVPTVEELRGQASGLYDAAEARGVVATPQMTQSLAQRVQRIARQNELITPTGRVSGAYPRASEAMNLLDDYAGHPMNPTQMQVIRDTLADARNATKGKERRIAGMMLDAFDDFTTPLAPELEQARRLSQRAFKGADLERLRELAASRAGQFSGSGYENALRTEYRGLDRRIVKGQEQGWSPAQHEAIQRVSRGTWASNRMRDVGKLAPSGVVSLGMTSGIPFMIGNAVGGPVAGSLASAATMGTGFAARDVATRMSGRSADLAELLARNGGSLASRSTEEMRRMIFNAIIGAQAAQQGQ